MPSRMNHRCGFSLRDLVITLVMLVVVLVLLLPMLQSIQRTQDATACQVNLRANGLATLAYSQDNEGRFPQFGFDLSTDDQDRLQVDIVLRDAPASGIDQYQADNLICPSDRDQGYLWVGENGSGTRRVAVGYGYNIGLIQTPQTADGLDSPATSVVLFDGAMSGSGGLGKDVSGFYQDTFAFVQHASTHRHDDQINLVYADWHTVTVDAPDRSSIELPAAEDALD